MRRSGGVRLACCDPYRSTKYFSLEGHAVLHSDTAAERLDALDVAVGNGFAVIEEPMQAVEGDFPVHFFIDIQCPLDVSL